MFLNFQINKREFEFDCYFHQILKEAATPKLDDDKIISDEELCNAGCGDITALRRFIVESKIPFSIPSYSDGIDKIQIDISALKNKIENDVSEYSHEEIRPEIILKLLEKKEKAAVAVEEKLDKKCKEAGIKTGDYICIKKGDLRIGVIKEIELCYGDGLKIQYNVLKNDLTESRSPLKEAYCKNEFFYMLQQEVVEEEKKNGSLKTKQQLAVFFRKAGVKNPLFKGEKV